MQEWRQCPWGSSKECQKPPGLGQRVVKPCRHKDMALAVLGVAGVPPQPPALHLWHFIAVAMPRLELGLLRVKCSNSWRCWATATSTEVVPRRAPVRMGSWGVTPTVTPVVLRLLLLGGWGGSTLLPVLTAPLRDGTELLYGYFSCLYRTALQRALRLRRYWSLVLCDMIWSGNKICNDVIQRNGCFNISNVAYKQWTSLLSTLPLCCHVEAF